MRFAERIFSIYALIFFISMYSFNNSICYETTFPQDLMYNNKPLHPECILSVRPLGGFSESQLINLENWNLLPYNFDVKTNTVMCKDHSHYIYIGTYNNKHLVLSYEYGGGSGIFVNLGLIQRNGDMIVNAGDIASGDRGCGGNIKVEHFKDGNLRYSQIFCHMGNAGNPFPNPIQLFYQVNLDSIESYKQVPFYLYDIKVLPSNK